MTSSLRPGNWDKRLSEGWQFGVDEDTGAEVIIRVEPKYAVPIDQPIFSSDEEAIAFVKTKAEAGSQYHIECLAHAVKERLKHVTR